jgi:cation:H+ antiporter
MLPAGRTRVIAVSVGVLVLLSVCTGATVAQESGEPGTTEETEDGGELLDVSGWAAVGALLLGTVVLVASVELHVHALVYTALRCGVPAFLLAVVFSGWEFDNVAVGLCTGFAEMQNVALGPAIGNAVSIFGLTPGGTTRGVRSSRARRSARARGSR